jgi:chromosome segregation ATPase
VYLRVRLAEEFSKVRNRYWRAVIAEARNLTDGREAENQQLRAVVASLNKQLDEARLQAQSYQQQAEEMRAQSSTAGKAGEELKEKVHVTVSESICSCNAASMHMQGIRMYP